MRTSEVSSDVADSDTESEFSNIDSRNGAKSVSSPSKIEEERRENDESTCGTDSPSGSSVIKRHSVKSKRATITNKDSRRPRKRRNSIKEERVLGIKIIKSSTLKFDKNIRTPRVKVSLFDENTGKLLKKSKAEKNVVFNQEPDTLDYILPIISTEGQMDNEFFFKWNEIIIINDDVEYFKKQNLLIFYEIIDVSRAHNKNGNKKKIYGGWYHICWAFLRLTQQKEQKFDMKTTLQLFKYQNASRDQPVFQQWLFHTFKKYPGSLEIQLITVLPKPEDVGLTRPQTALQIDRKFSEKTCAGSQEDFPPKASWTKALATICNKSFMPPQNVLFECQINGGSTVCAFSPDGQYIAYADNSEKSSTKIIVRQCSDLGNCLNLRGHNSLIHSLEWCEIFVENLTMLISTSEDKNCIIWQIEEHSYKLRYVLPHPCYLYCAIFVPSFNSRTPQIVTGGRNAILYTWDIFSVNARILQELRKHCSYIIGVGYCAKLHTIFSAEVYGKILEWKYDEDLQTWIENRQFDLKALIKQFYLNQSSSNIYILLKQAFIKIDTHSGAQLKILCNYVGSINASKFTMSPNGAYIFFATHLSIVCFHPFSDEIISKFKLRSTHDRISSIHFQSHRNLLAVSTQSKLHGGGFIIYSPDEHKNIKMIAKKENDPIQRTSLQNSAFSDILNKLEKILKISQSSNPMNTKSLKEIPKDEKLTYSIKADRTFVVPEISNGKHRIIGDYDLGQTFVVYSPQHSDGTDISENMLNSKEQESTSEENTNRTITICKGVK